MSSVALLPKELARPDKRRGMLEFPTNYVSPLVKQQRQIAIRMNPLSETRVHNRFTRRPDRDRLGQLTLTALCDPRYFRREALDVILLLV